MSSCLYCGAPLESDSQFCANCGKKIELCPRCGAMIKADGLFFAKCGARLDMQVPSIMNSPQVVCIESPPQIEDEVVDEWEKERMHRVPDPLCIFLLFVW